MSSLRASAGPNPVLQSADVIPSTDNYIRVRDSIVRRAGYSATDLRVDWYEVTRAGFGYVDEQCSAYLSALFDLRRDRDLFRKQMSSITSAATPILEYSGVADKAIKLTAAALGLSSQLFDNANAALLFAMEPADVNSLVNNQMAAYRSGVANQRSNYKSSNAAMEAIRGYLNLCLPVTIEAQVKAAVQGVVFSPKATKTGTPDLVRVQTSSGSVTGLTPTREDLQSKPIGRPSISEQDLSPGLVADKDERVSLAQMKEIQARLCVAEDGKIGKTGSNTRNALRILQKEKTNTPEADRGYLDISARIAINELKPCVSGDYKTAFENIVLNKTVDLIDVQTKLKKYVKDNSDFDGGIVSIVDSPGFVGGDRLSQNNREVIKAIQTKANLSQKDGVYSEAVRGLITP